LDRRFVVEMRVGGANAELDALTSKQFQVVVQENVARMKDERKRTKVFTQSDDVRKKNRSELLIENVSERLLLKFACNAAQRAR
jgi:hypothetical protein